MTSGYILKNEKTGNQSAVIFGDIDTAIHFCEPGQIVQYQETSGKTVTVYGRKE